MKINCEKCGIIMIKRANNNKYCVSCSNIMKKEWKRKYYLKNKGVLDKKAREFYYKNKGYYQEYHKKWARKNRRRIDELARLRYKRNPEKYKLAQKRYRETENGRKKIRERHKLKKYKEYFSSYKKTDKRKAYDRAYIRTENGRTRNRIRLRKRRALERGCINTITEKESKIIQKRDKRCVYCNNDKNLTFDHIVPINKGGENSFLNGVISCKSCNSSKGDKDVIEWCKSKEQEVPKIIINNLKLMGLRKVR